MAVPLWQPGTLYAPGDIVQPVTAPAPTSAQVANGGFEDGNSGWDFTGGAEFSTTGGYGNNGSCVTMPGSVSDGLALNQTKLVIPSNASSFEASAMIKQGAAIAGATRGWVEVRWYDEDDVLLGSVKGNIVSDSSGSTWKKSTVTATKPSGAAYARAGIGLFSVADHSHPIWGDSLSVSGTFSGLPDGLVYRAVQADSGYSGTSEPAWPPILGVQVVDNEVTWEAVSSTRVTWEASPLYVSGTSEPDWPTDMGSYVQDGTINWQAVPRRVEDENCPNSKFVVIAASKVYAGDDDIVRYCATVNPLDWTTENDAGYIPTGLQNYGSNPVEAMGLYRGNLIPFNAEAFQLWQVDEDPANIALLDALPMGSTKHHAIAPVSNDLFFLASQGVRTVGIAASSTNFQAGDVGMPVDPLVQESMRESAAPIGLYFPSAGQYWLAFNSYPSGGPSIHGDAHDCDIGDVYPTFAYDIEGDGVYAFLRSGILPYGLALSSGGVISGTPTVAGTYQFQVGARDQYGRIASVTDSITVRPDSIWAGSMSGLSGNLYSHGGVTWIDYEGSISGPYLMVWDGSKFVGVGFATNSTTAVNSVDGKNWTVITGQPETGINALTVHDAIYLAVGVGGGCIRSTDGEMFVSQDMGSVANFYDVVWFKDKFVAVGYSARGSFTGETWTELTTFIVNAATVMRGVATSGEKIVAVGDNNAIAVSSDAATWATTISPFPDGSVLSEVTYAFGKWIVASQGGDIRTSSNLTSWSDVVCAMAALPSGFSLTAGLLVAYGASGKIFTTTDGEIWEDRSIAGPSGTVYSIAGKEILVIPEESP